MISRRKALLGLGAAFTLAGGAYWRLHRGNDNDGLESPSTPHRTPTQKGLQYVVIDADTGRVISGKHANKIRHPASLTKLMTLAVVFDAMADRETNFKLNSLIEIPRSINLIGRGIAVFERLKPGEKYRARDLMIGAGSRSDAYSTLALAIHLGSKDVYNWPGNEAKKMKRFLQEMNKKAREIGMRNSNFSVITGVPHRDNYSTPEDMAKLLLYLRRHHAQRAEIALGNVHFDISAISNSRDHTSRLLRSRPKEILFAKTGYTNAAGFCLATFARKSGHNFAGVVFGARDRRHRNQVMRDILSDAERKLAVAPAYRMNG